ncbi:MAG: DUF4159 domain-containing protein [Gemmatimonadetes bacterium]|nr:DUF4159 domain-containing protein [Gemmatimonadota bacterium]
MRVLPSSVGAAAGAIALIVLLGSPPARTDATTPSDATNTESSAPLPKAQARFLSSTGVSEALGALRAPIEAGVGAESRADAAQILTIGIPHEFYFSRVAYSGCGGFYGRGSSWRTDYPRADEIFLSFIDRLLPNLDAFLEPFVVFLDDPDLRRFPFLYALEVGRMALRPAEIEGLRGYLLQGGFLVIDDFWGTREWANFEYEIQQVLPGYEIVDLDIDHNIFTTFYEIDEMIQVPNIGIRNCTAFSQADLSRCPTWERDGFIPMVKGIHDEKGRLMVIINWNTDLGDAWEWADDPLYPFVYSKYAYEMGVNFIVYAMSH